MKIDDYFYTVKNTVLPSSNDQRVFRYDNAPHHPEIATHPHHKHISRSDRLTPADQPSLSQVFAEIEGLLGHQAG